MKTEAFEVLSPVRIDGVRCEIGETVTRTDLNSGSIDSALKEAAIKPIPVLFEEPIVDPVVPGDQAAPLPEISDKMTVSALSKIAVDESVTIGDGFTKAEIIAAIALKRALDNPGPREERLE